MKPGKGKEKGGGFERAICAKLSLWISKGAQDDLLCRTVGSGAQFTMSARGNAGDLMAQHPDAFRFFESFVVECKFWKDLQIHRFLWQEGDLYKALLKVEIEAKTKGKSWWLVAKQNHQPTLLFLPVEGLAHFHPYAAYNRDYHAIFRGTVYMYKLDQFLENIPIEALK